MIPIMTRAQMRAYDQHAINECRVPGLILMENAGRSAAEHIAELALRQGAGDGKAVVIVCGRGNNGGDGFVVARQLLARGIRARVYLIGEAERVKGDARANLEAYVGLAGQPGQLSCILGGDLRALQAELQQGPAVVVDAIFGTGLDREVGGSYVDIIRAINRCPAPCVALDIPSGIDADSGAVLGIAIEAEMTVTFGHLKAGFLLARGAEHAGEIRCEGLGIPDEAIVAEVGCLATLVEPEAVAAALGQRSPDAHKYRSGSVLVVAGSPGKIGAALLCGEAALRTGAGIVTLASWPAAVSAFESRVTELMTARIDRDDLAKTVAAALERRNAVAIGPGLGLDGDARALTEHVVLGWDGPVVVDADAISHFAGRAGVLQQARGPRILTPHSGELGRLLDVPVAQIQADRLGMAATAAAQTGCTVLLKGRNTVIASPDGRLQVCARGDAVLATGGSGDVLTGIIAALCCQADPAQAASAGAFIHALAADRWRALHGADRGLIAGDINAGIPDAIAALQDPSRQLEAGSGP